MRGAWTFRFRSNAARVRMSRPVLETERLSLHRLNARDARFILELLTDPCFIANIGDRGVYSHATAEAYVEHCVRESYRAHGFGLWKVVLDETRESVGMCGLVRRTTLPAPDLGYAFLPGFRHQGYAVEAAAATQRFAAQKLGLQRIYAVISPSNLASIRVVQKLGFALEGRRALEPDSVPLDVYVSAALGSD